MTKIYREPFRFFLSSLPTLLMFAAMIEGSLWVLQPRSEGSITWAALTTIAYFMHRHFLFGAALHVRPNKPVLGAPPQKFGWFMVVSAALLVLPVLVMVVVAVRYLGSQQTAAIILITLLTYLLMLSLFGTALPATVARDGTYRLRQGVRASFQTMWRLVLGPGTFGVLLLVVLSFSDRAMAALGLAETSLIMLGYLILLRTVGFLTTILAVAVLCEMYRQTRPKPGPNMGPDMGPDGADQTPA